MLGIVVLAAAACGSSSKHPIAPVATTATTGPHPYSDATAERNRLLNVAKPGTRVTAQGVAGWPPANGSAIPATATEISGFGFNVEKKHHAQYLSFAVSDSSGACAGGDIVTNSKGTKVISAKAIRLPGHAPCTGNEVAKVAGHM